jgi:hypothetical protein
MIRISSGSLCSGALDFIKVYKEEGAQIRKRSGGGSRIRTHEGVTPLTVFKTAAFSHLAIPPRSL